LVKLLYGQFNGFILEKEYIMRIRSIQIEELKVEL
jgi:hypothetical protein